MSAGLQVRAARPHELGACADLYVEVLRETFTWLPPERHRREDFLRAARDEEIYVATQHGVIVGIAGFYRPQNFIHSLYVKCRMEGVGSALLAYLAQAADGPLSLKVQSPNLAARAFYARRGFQEAEQGQDGDIAWVRLIQAE